MLVIYYLKIEFSSGKRDAAHCWLCTEGTESDITENHWTGKKKSREHSMREPLMHRPEHAVTKGEISRDVCTLRTKEKGKSSLFRVQIGR